MGRPHASGIVGWSRRTVGSRRGPGRWLVRGYDEQSNAFGTAASVDLRAWEGVDLGGIMYDLVYGDGRWMACTNGTVHKSADGIVREEVVAEGLVDASGTVVNSRGGPVPCYGISFVG